MKVKKYITMALILLVSAFLYIRKVRLNCYSIKKDSFK